jgi:hypothetical protein
MPHGRTRFRAENAPILHFCYEPRQKRATCAIWSSVWCYRLEEPQQVDRLCIESTEGALSGYSGSKRPSF